MAADFAELRAVQHRLTDALVELELDLRSPATRLTLASDFRSGALPLPFSGHSISFARLPVLLFSGHLPVFPQENAFSNNFQKNAAFWKNPENIWLKFGQNSAKFWEILQKFCKNQRNFQRFLMKIRN